MKKIIVMLLLLAPSFCFAGAADIVLSQVYGSISTACTQDADADTGESNVLGPFIRGKLYTIYCHDGAGAGSACECLQGTSAVDASSSIGMTLFAGEKVIMKFGAGNLYISCVPAADNQYIDVCPLRD